MDEESKVLVERIRELKKSRNALILAHNYELGEIQDVADFCGDSLELALKAAQSDAEVLVFCGVSFMAETAKILAPEKHVLLPVAAAGCDMADMIDGAAVRKLKSEHPGAVAICYVNSTAEVKAECDYCVTSANALKIVASVPEDQEIIFVPDMNLGRYCQRETGRKMIFQRGFCPIHMRITAEMILRRKREFPDAVTIIHPESTLEAINLADAVLSTGKMLSFVQNSSAKQFLVATEVGILHRLQKENANKVFIPISEQCVCYAMKMIRLENLLHSLETMTTEVFVPEAIAAKALVPIRRMLEFR